MRKQITLYFIYYQTEPRIRNFKHKLLFIAPTESLSTSPSCHH